ncbi:MAG: hypothetical protein RL077_4262 [Verrucomicrobiota bacterium]
MAVAIAAGHDGGGVPIEVDAEKGLGLRGRLDGVDRGVEGAVGAVLETEGHGETARHLAVSLGFRGAGADGTPAHQIRDILRGDGIEEFCSGGQAEIEDVAEEGAPEAETGGDIVGTIKVGIHHQPFPADGRARFFKVHPHDDEHAVGDLAGQRDEASGVFAAGIEIVNRARPDDEQKAPVGGEDEPLNIAARLSDKLGLRFGFWQLGQQRGG